MKTRVFLAVALVFSLAMMSCGNKKAAEANSETHPARKRRATMLARNNLSIKK